MSDWFAAATRTARSRAGNRRGARKARFPGSGPRWIGRPEVEYDDPPDVQDWLNAADANRVGQSAEFVHLRERRGPEVEDFFQLHLDGNGKQAGLIWSIRRYKIEALEPGMDAVGILQKVNNSRWLNKYFRAVNSRLRIGGVLVGCLEANDQRRQRMCAKYPKIVGDLYAGLDFLVHRLCPKVPVLKKIYFAVSRGHNRPLSTAEALGRLVSCGFQIIDYRSIGGMTYFAVRKCGESARRLNPTYGPLCALHRVGKNRRKVIVYKLRTMHPYSEFLQEYLFATNGTEDGNKIINDFRIAPWGAFLRRVWIDELPMLINLLKGDLKIVGVRPLSVHKFNTYAPALQELRCRFKPGLIPPCYVDIPENAEAFFASEERYLRAYEKAPVRTDIRYFCRAVWNICTAKARSA